MYARQYPDELQTFRSGGNTIPANYAGNAFTAGEEILPDAPVFEPEADDAPKTQTPAVHEALRRDDPPRRGGLFDDLIARFSRGFELDDLILIGLFFLLLRSGEDRGGDRDELILLLALLFFTG